MEAKINLVWTFGISTTKRFLMNGSQFCLSCRRTHNHPCRWCKTFSYSTGLQVAVMSQQGQGTKEVLADTQAPDVVSWTSTCFCPCAIHMFADFLILPVVRSFSTFCLPFYWRNITFRWNLYILVLKVPNFHKVPNSNCIIRTEDKL